MDSTAQRPASVEQGTSEGREAGGLASSSHGPSPEFSEQVRSWVPGTTLRRRLDRGPLSVEECLQVGSGILRALQAAHEAGVLHHRLKPSHLLLGTEGLAGEVTLIDFGLALDDPTSPSLQALPLVDARYLSPEQAGLVVDGVGPSSDLYAVGVLLFECLAGVPPFHGDTLGALLQQQLTASPELRSLGVAVPRALEQVVQHLMRKDPRERYQTARAALEDLEAIGVQWGRGEREPSRVVALSDPRRQLNEPAFIGRRVQLEALEGALSEGARGEGRLVFVEGESGSGKTQLLDELARRASMRGVRVLRAQGLDQEGQHPLQCLTGVFQGVLTALEESPALAQEVRTRLGEQLDLVCTVLPRLAPCLGQQKPTRLAPEAMRGGGMVPRALSAPLEALASARGPVVVLLDDCQWADELTLKLLALWLQPPVQGRYVTVVAAFRPETLGEEHPLRRMRPGCRVTVTPLLAPDLRQLAESMAGRLPVEALDTVERLSEGNPFMASAVVRGLVEGGALVPGPSGWRVEPRRLSEVGSSRQAAAFLLRRLELLSEPARALLAVGAILGREFDASLAATLARQEGTRAHAALEEARRRHLLWPGPTLARWCFSHDRLRETLLRQLPAEQARALHLAAALELERRAPERSFELAYHFEAAEEPRRAWPHALEAARRAQSQYAPEMAERHYRLAERGAVEADGTTRLAILEGLSEVLYVQKKHQEAERSLERARSFATSRLERARLEAQHGKVLVETSEFTGSITAYQRALHLLGQRVPGNRCVLAACLLWEVFVRVLPPHPPGRRAHRSTLPQEEARLCAYIHTCLSEACWRRDDTLTSLWSHLRGLNIAERSIPGPALASAYARHGTSFVWFQSLPHVPAPLRTFFLRRERKYFQAASRLHESLGDVSGQGFTLMTHTYLLFHTARFAECIEVGREAERLLLRAGASTWALGVRSTHALALYCLGELPAALEVVRGSSFLSAAPEPDFSAIYLLVQAYASEGRLPRERLEAEFTRMASAPDTVYKRFFHSNLLQAEGIRLLATGAAGRAAQVFTQALEEMGRLDGVRIVGHYVHVHPWLMTALRQESLQVSPYDSARRATLLRRARAVARQGLRIAEGVGMHPHLYRELGRIAALEQHPARARRYFARSLAIAERLGMRYERAQTLLARAEVGTALGWPGAARDAELGEQAVRACRGTLKPAPFTEAQASLSLVDRFPRILEAGRTLASALTREAVFSALREAARGLLRGEQYELIEVKDEGRVVPGSLGGPLRAIVLRVLEDKRPRVPSREELEQLGTPGPRSVLCAPLLVRGQVEACFCVTSQQLAGAFGEQEARIAEFMAALAGAALENAQGFAEVNALSEERQRLYEQTRAALRKRDEFLAVASHELRTPFTPMRLYMQGLLNALRQPSRAANLEPWVAKLDLANARLQRLARLVEDLFDASRLSHGLPPLRLSEVDLGALTTEAVDRWSPELARVGCECVLEPPVQPVVGCWDALRLEQVIDSLLSNALKYGPGKPIHLRVARDGELARLVVSDQGLGIAAEDQSRIFERFERAVSEDNYGGFGLGLWISREVVRALGGRISVESALHQGATFTIELPLTPPP